MKSQVQAMAQTTLSDLLSDSQNIYSNWNTSQPPIYAHGSNDTVNSTDSPADEIDDLRYSITTSVILM